MSPQVPARTPRGWCARMLCSTCQGRSPAKPEGGGFRLSDSLEIRKIATLTNEYVGFFSFEEGFSAITGSKDLFASNKYLTG